MTANPTLHSQLVPALNLGTLVLNFEQPAANADTNAMRKKLALPAQLMLLPAHLALGGATPAVLSASLTRAGYELNLQGEADAQRLQDFLFTLGLPPAPGLNRTQ